MPNRELVEHTVFQDGSDFYSTSHHDLLACYNKHAIDYDMDTAREARAWFVDEFCPANRIAPTFVEETAV